MTTKDGFLYVIIIILAAVILKDGCQKDSGFSGTSDTIRTETVFRYDTVIHEILTHNIIYRDTVLIIDSSADTTQVWNDYFTKYHFSDLLQTDSIEATYSGDIWKNSLFNPEFKIRYKFPTSSQTTTILAPRKASLHAGFFFTYNNPNGLNIGAQATLQDKGGHLWTLGYGSDKTALIGLQWNLRKK